MIHIEVDITYSKPLNKAERERVAEAIRLVLQPTIVTAACSVTQDGVAPDWEGAYIRSQYLNVDTVIKVADPAPPSDIRNEGYRAQARGLTMADNPYPAIDNMSQHWEWRKGYLEAFHDSN